MSGRDLKSPSIVRYESDLSLPLIVDFRQEILELPPLPESARCQYSLVTIYYQNEKGIKMYMSPVDPWSFYHRLSLISYNIETLN